jgi:hypothetical protein
MERRRRETLVRASKEFSKVGKTTFSAVDSRGDKIFLGRGRRTTLEDLFTTPDKGNSAYERETLRRHSHLVEK